MYAFRCTKMSGKWYAIEVDIDRSKEIQARNSLMNDGEIVVYAKDISDLAGAMGIEESAITVVEPED